MPHWRHFNASAPNEMISSGFDRIYRFAGLGVNSTICVRISRFWPSTRRAAGPKIGAPLLNYGRRDTTHVTRRTNSDLGLAPAVRRDVIAPRPPAPRRPLPGNGRWAAMVVAPAPTQRCERTQNFRSVRVRFLAKPGFWFGAFLLG